MLFFPIQRLAFPEEVLEEKEQKEVHSGLQGTERKSRFGMVVWRL